jgi:cell wall-associated NlpC family hydrolase
MCAILCSDIEVHAQAQDVTVKNGDYVTVNVHTGDTGNIIPDLEDLQVVTRVFSLADNYYGSSSVLELGQDGSYKAIDTGSQYVEVYGYDELNDEIFYAQVVFEVTIDMTYVTLQQSQVVAYMMPYYDGEGNAYYYGTSASIGINSPVVIPDDIDFSVVSSSSKYDVSAELENNQINLSISGEKEGDSTLTITMGEKVFTVWLQVKKVGISKSSLLLGKKQSKTLKVTGYSGKVTWMSYDSKIAKVSKNGKVTGKKYGNTVIIAKIGEQYLGCAVSVTTSKLVKVCARAEYIGRNWEYSQPKRTQKGYYDCSALVWKAYKQYTNINFGSSGYPGTTATESAWCKSHNRVLKGKFKLSMVSKMTMLPGDLVFKSSSKKKKYSTTYHVEMFTGYTCVYVDSNGKPSIAGRWGARESGYEYGISDGYIVARPMKY